MGEVYKARDTRLHRTVAIKVLKADVAADASARARFEREAHAIAALSHPHICTIHDVGREGDTDYLVMEYLEGETLADRLAKVKGPLPFEQVLSIAIADALDKAHRAGITHRDLKPANVMLTKTGPKLLDFGLAKLRGAASPVVSMMDPSGDAGTTAVGPATAKGTILGTIHYMAPEQVEGREADTRSDIWALGALLYEMATGQRPFDGDSAASVIGAILKDTPPVLSVRQPLTPASFEHLVERCLEKDPDERWQSAKDLMGQLAWAQSQPSDSVRARAGTLGQGASWTRMPLTLAAVGFGLAAGAGVMALRSVPPAGPIVMRLELDLPTGVEVAGSARPAICLSPQGDRVAFVGSAAGLRRLYIRNLNEFDATALKGTETATTCVFSPDGRALGFYTSNGVLKTVALADGLVTSVVVDAHYESGVSWGSDNRITFGKGGPLWQVSAGGAAAEPLTHLDLSRGERFHAQPFPVPSAHAVLFAAITGGVRTTTEIGSVDTSTRARHLVVEDASNPFYLTTGHLLFFRDGALLAAPFDAARMEVKGAAVPVVDNVSLDQLGNPIVTFSDNGHMAFVPRTSATKRLVWVSRQGVEEPITETSRPYQNPRLSPDGRRIVVETAGGELWVHDLGRATFTRLTSGETLGNSFAVWAPDSQHVVYRTMTGIRVIDANAPGSSVPIPNTSVVDIPSSISTDGQTLAFVRQTGNGTGGIFTVPLAGQATEQSLLKGAGYIGAAQFSPDGRLMAYVSDESGKFEVYVRALGATERRVQVSPAGGTHPHWSRDGRELFYRSGNKMLAVSVDGNARLTLSPPRLLFEQRYAFGTAQTIPNYDVSADSERFLMVKDDSSSGRINVVLNWAEELKAKVAASHE